MHVQKMLYIAMKDVRIRIRDRKGLLLSFAMPLILIAILGMALSQAMDQQSNSFPKITLAVYNGDHASMSDELVNHVLQSKELKPYISIVNATTADSVQKQVASGKADSGIVIPASFTQDVTQNRPTHIDVLQDPGKQVEGQIIDSITTSFTSRVQAVVLSSQWAIQQLATASGSDATASTSMHLAAISQQVVHEIQERAADPKVKVQDQSVGAKPVSSIQYYAAAEAVMFMLFNATLGAKSFIQERSTVTLARLYMSPTSRSTILFGKFFGTLFFSTLQFVVLMLATQVLFGVSWGGQPLQTFLIGFLFAIAVSGLSMLVVAFVDSEESVDVIANTGVYLLAALGGSMMPFYFFPDIMQSLAHLAPNTWALTSFLAIMEGTSWNALLAPMAVLFAIGAVSVSIGTLRLRTRQG